MRSQTAIITKVYGKDKVIRYWDISQIRNNKDALLVEKDDYLLFKEVTFQVTYCGNTKSEGMFQPGHRAWVGRMFGAKERWGFNDNAVVAWGPKGMADNFANYEKGKFFPFCLGTDSYLWLG